jgi:hypothetical protein
MWEIELSGEDQSSVGSLVERLLDRVPSDADWSAVVGTCEITFGLYVLLTSENQDFVIPPKQLARIAAIGAELWCDLYVGDRPSEPS